MLHRSLGQVDAASNIEGNLAKAAPRESAVLTRLGEMQADREKFAAAKPHWEKIPEIEPGKPEGVIETATFAVSLEPAGGSPAGNKPTGPVLFHAKLVQATK